MWPPNVAGNCNLHVAESYQVPLLKKFVESSVSNMGLETLDLVQLHCPPTAVSYRPEIFEMFDRLKGRRQSAKPWGKRGKKWKKR